MQANTAITPSQLPEADKALLCAVQALLDGSAKFFASLALRNQASEMGSRYATNSRVVRLAEALVSQQIQGWRVMLDQQWLLTCLWYRHKAELINRRNNYTLSLASLLEHEQQVMTLLRSIPRRLETPVLKQHLASIIATLQIQHDNWTTGISDALEQKSDRSVSD